MEPGEAAPESPEAALALIREYLGDDEEFREDELVRMVGRFPVDRLVAAARSRLSRLGEADGEAVLRLVEAYATPELMNELALALVDQPSLPADRAWEALALVEGADLLDDYPELAERWDELNDSVEADDALGALAAQLEEEPEGSWVALQGIGAVEPEIRVEIIAGLADYADGPGLVAFLRLLAFAHDGPTRLAAIDALARRGSDDADHRAAWASIARDHTDSETRDRARRRLAIDSDPDLAIAEARARPDWPRPEPVGCLVTSLDGEGRGSIVLASRDRGRWVVASYLCDVWHGVVDVVGQAGDGPTTLASGLFDEIADARDRAIVEDAPALASGLLAGSMLLCGPGTNPALRYWLERTAGPDFQARPFLGPPGDVGLDALALGPLGESARAVLDACPDWVDRSPLTFELAEEIALRSGSGESGPDPARDAGAYRYLFEHRLLGRLEHYRRMLLWMASFWDASDRPDLARSALALDRQLADPQHAVPAHPFTVELTTRSLRAARSDFREGRDHQVRA